MSESLRDKVRKDRAKRCVHINLSNGGTCTHLAEGMENRMCYILEPRLVEYNLHEKPEWVDYCPFCGGKASLQDWTQGHKPGELALDDTWGVACENEGCPCNPATGDNYRSAEAAEEAWNRRAQ